MNVTHHVERGAREFPNRPALIFDGREISYRDCHERASAVAGSLISAGVRVGDRVALVLPNSPDFVFAYLASLKLGAIAVSVNPGLTRDEVGFVLCDCEAKTVIAAPELRQCIPTGDWGVITSGPGADSATNIAGRDMKSDEAAAIVYTSGTTGRPKGATLSHGNVTRNAAAKRLYLGIRPSDRALLFLPLHHCFGQNAVLNAFLESGATIILHRRFDIERTIESIRNEDITILFGVPSTYLLLLGKLNREDTKTIRLYFSAAAPLSVEIERKWLAKFGLPICQGYGLTETSPFASYNHREQPRVGSIGTPIEGVEMKIVNPETGADQTPGSRGEIVVRGHNVMLGYWNRPAETAAAIRDGWFHTGDIGWMGADGYFFIEDRLTDMIITGGCNVYPAEVERVLLTHPAVAEAAVYGVPEPLMGEQVCADIVLQPGQLVSTSEVCGFCREQLSSTKIPSVVRMVGGLPKGPTGKIMKRLLRNQATDAFSSNGSMRQVSAAEAERWIIAWLRANLPPTVVDRRTPFLELGVDSALAVQLATGLSAWLGHDLPVTIAWNSPTIEAMAKSIAAGGVADYSPRATACLPKNGRPAVLDPHIPEFDR